MGKTVNCWRCNRTIAAVEGAGSCAVVVVCKRCNAQNRIDCRGTTDKLGLDKLASSGTIHLIK